MSDGHQANPFLDEVAPSLSQLRAALEEKPESFFTVSVVTHKTMRTLRLAANVLYEFYRMLEDEAKELKDIMDSIEERGYRVHLVEYCEDARTPGLLGQLLGVTDHARREVKVRTKNRNQSEILETLIHELHHVDDPTWECGNKDVFGRGT
jgi:hypothetical protein